MGRRLEWWLGFQIPGSTLLLEFGGPSLSPICFLSCGLKIELFILTLLRLRDSPKLIILSLTYLACRQWPAASHALLPTNLSSLASKVEFWLKRQGLPPPARLCRAVTKPEPSPGISSRGLLPIQEFSSGSEKRAFCCHVFVCVTSQALISRQMGFGARQIWVLFILCHNVALRPWASLFTFHCLHSFLCKISHT